MNEPMKMRKISPREIYLILLTANFQKKDLSLQPQRPKLTCRYVARRNSSQVQRHVGQNGISRWLLLVLLAPRGVTVQERNRTGDKDNLHLIHRLL